MHCMLLREHAMHSMLFVYDKEHTLINENPFGMHGMQTVASFVYMWKWGHVMQVMHVLSFQTVWNIGRMKNRVEMIVKKHIPIRTVLPFLRDASPCCRSSRLFSVRFQNKWVSSPARCGIQRRLEKEITASALKQYSERFETTEKR